jgi:alkanesulfonate monooxygenase SsuD/methylene tetrahydromethanopterin reductase-like flavin-dependent oxidoreductase (luciferase family)
MKLWYFTEQQYHPAWERVSGSIRNTPPSGLIDPDTAADLIDRYYEEFAALDELGLNIAVNEHHTSYQSMSTAPYLTIAALARTTKKVRLLSIGTPIAQRPDPVRVAEEIALTDIMSRGRTEAGLIKSIPWEYFNCNANPMRLMERFWEAHDLIIKALTTRDGPFAWDGEFFQYRNVNVMPRPYQDPYPPIWIAGMSPNSARDIAAKGYVGVTTQNGFDATKFFAAYRDTHQKTFGRPANLDRLAYVGYLALGSNERQARERAQRVHKWVEFLARQHPAFQHAAGYAPAKDFARLMRMGKGASPFTNYVAPSIDQLREQNIFFFGTPDQVYRQIESFYGHCQGFGHLLFQMGGYATQEDTIDSARLLMHEIAPRLNELEARFREAA